MFLIVKHAVIYNVIIILHYLKSLILYRKYV